MRALGATMLFVLSAVPLWAQKTPMDVANADGTATSKMLSQTVARVPDQPVNSEVLPGYQGTAPDLGALMGTSDTALTTAGAGATGTDAYRVMQGGDANRSRIAPADLAEIRNAARAVTDNPAPYAGLAVSGTQGQCEKVSNAADAGRYEATCNIGTILVPVGTVEQLSCPAGYTLSERTCSRSLSQPATVHYACPTGYLLSGTSCISTREAVVAGYSCPSGYTVVGSNCVRTETQAAEVSYTCPSGATLSGSTCTSSAGATVASYTCPPGDVLSGTSCIHTDAVEALVTYACPAGFTRSGTTCVSSQAASLSNYACPAGYTVSGTTCGRLETLAATVSGYSCSTGFMLEGSSCRRTLTQSATPVYSCTAGAALIGTTCTQSTTSAATATYSCPAGGSLSGESCVTTSTFAATANYYCPSGYSQSGTTCTQTSGYGATTTYSCPLGGSLNGVICATTQSQNAAPNYQCSQYTNGADKLTISGAAYCGTPKNWYAARKCPTTQSNYFAERKIGSVTYCVFYPTTTYTCPGDLWTLQDTVCSLVSTTNASVTTTCPSGGTLSGSTCTSTNTIPASLSYSCPAGAALAGSTCTTSSAVLATLSYACAAGTLSGSTCTTSTSTGANVSYTCPAAYSLSGTVCSFSEVAVATPIYSCPTGFDLMSTTCSRTLSQPASPVYACPAGYTLSGSMCSGSLAATTVRYCSGDYALSEDMCMRTSSSPATPSYSCLSGARLSGSTCTTTSDALPVYSCPPDALLTGSTCTKTQTEPGMPELACPTGHMLRGSMCRSTVTATASYSCPADYVLRDMTCSLAQQLPATSRASCPNGASVQDGQCLLPQAGQSDCAPLEINPACAWVRDDCLDEVPGASCLVKERVFSCPVPVQPSADEYVCQGGLWCVDGSCRTVEREANDELGSALIAMGAVDQTEKEFDPAKLSLFEGTAGSCHKPLFGAINCCAGKVSGVLSGGAAAAAKLALGAGPAAVTAVATQFLTTFACSNGEKELDIKDRLGLCHYVGTYCSSSILGVCQSKSKSYCCFQSKLTRIIQEQGRPQLEKDWGTPKSPACKGFTAEEFSKLDLSQMDFSEIYQDMLEAMSLPDQAAQASEIQQKIQGYYQQSGGGGGN